jgi:hypothetical protein
MNSIPMRAFIDHAVDGIAPAAAYANDFDASERFGCGLPSKSAYRARPAGMWGCVLLVSMYIPPFFFQ